MTAPTNPVRIGEKIGLGAPHLIFGGLQAYHGSTAFARVGGAPPSDRAGRRQGRADPRPLGAPRHRVPDHHRRRHRYLRVRNGERRLHLYTELQCGSSIFRDADYGRNGAPTKAFEPSLFVWVTVMSRPTEDRALQR
jgi:3-hydroxy-D-aspartate aldolase